MYVYGFDDTRKITLLGGTNSPIPELFTCLEIHRLYTNDKYLNYWTSETRDISWDHMQFFESLLPKIYLSIKKIASHKLPRIAQRPKVLYIRILLFVNVGAFRFYLWWKIICTCQMLPIIVIFAGLQYRKSAPCRYYPVS